MCLFTDQRSGEVIAFFFVVLAGEWSIEVLGSESTVDSAFFLEDLGLSLVPVFSRLDYETAEPVGEQPEGTKSSGHSLLVNGFNFNSSLHLVHMSKHEQYVGTSRAGILSHEKNESGHSGPDPTYVGLVHEH